MKNQTKLLIDGDILLYEKCASVEVASRLTELVSSKYLKEISEGITNIGLVREDLSDVHIYWASEDDAIHAITEWLTDIKKKFNADQIVIALSDSKNFRKTVDPTYKSNRSKTRKPVTYLAAKSWLMKHFECVIMPELEADDVMGILATDPKETMETIIVTSDKDLEQIPGKLYKHNKDILMTCTAESGLRKLLEQSLTGDSVDGYIGLRGVGPVAATNILDGSGDSFETVVRAYLDKGETIEAATTSINLARMLTYNDWDFESASVRLWEPSGELLEAVRTLPTNKV